MDSRRAARKVKIDELSFPDERSAGLYEVLRFVTVDARPQGKQNLCASRRDTCDQVLRGILCVRDKW